MNFTKIKDLREEKNESRRNVALATGMTEQTIVDLERGKNKNPTIKTLSRLADHFHVSVIDLISDESDHEPSAR